MTSAPPTKAKNMDCSKNKVKLHMQERFKIIKNVTQSLANFMPIIVPLSLAKIVIL